MHGTSMRVEEWWIIEYAVVLFLYEKLTLINTAK